MKIPEFQYSATKLALGTNIIITLYFYVPHLKIWVCIGVYNSNIVIFVVEVEKRAKNEYFQVTIFHVQATNGPFQSFF